MNTLPTVLITGASQGIGAAIAQEAARAGCHPVLLARNNAGLEAVTAAIRRTGAPCSMFTCDVADTASVEATLASIQEIFGSLPLFLVNNAGWGGPFHRADEVPEDEWDYIFSVNVKAAYLFCRRMLPNMRAAEMGRIVNIASVFSVIGGEGSSTYAASKHALLGYTRALAVEWAPWNITCNAVSPGYVRTAMGAGAETAELLQQIPAGRLGTPEEIARLVIFLLQPESGYINGANFVADGGLTAR